MGSNAAAITYGRSREIFVGRPAYRTLALALFGTATDTVVVSPIALNALGML